MCCRDAYAHVGVALHENTDDTLAVCFERLYRFEFAFDKTQQLPSIVEHNELDVESAAITQRLRIKNCAMRRPPVIGVGKLATLPLPSPISIAFSASNVLITEKSRHSSARPNVRSERISISRGTT